ncbi:Biotin-protein ligase [Candidatus Sumerlaea chitinivorans]|uniref:biotin--[biotin carboxyl-carrier protein] ligase n=1 Tax=Sumerlaea chitinivorans TaxID=2250252 RepID=A0A2Z4Y4I5_SUMC1|nr:Biotin-protein ligase [Candidatus Sumerlaea chitinivorans]
MYVHDSKIAGILLENSGSEHEWFLVGIGVNVNQTRDELPSPAECQATSLFCETQRQFERPRVLRAILEKLSRWWELGDIAPLTRRMNELCYTIGRLVKIVLPETEIMGVALGIAPGGALLVRDSAGRTREVYAGDIRELRFIEPKP